MNEAAPIPITEVKGYDAIKEWLLGYAWFGSDAEKAAMVECIMAQDLWQHVDGLAERFAGAQEEPGPKAMTEGMGYALSALYECHDGPHLPTCPHYREG